MFSYRIISYNPDGIILQVIIGTSAILADGGLNATSGKNEKKNTPLSWCQVAVFSQLFTTYLCINI
jgi:hypothetical protein